MAGGRAAVIALPIAAVVVLIDQATKAWAVASLQGRPPVEVVGTWLQWSFATNPGAAFSLGTGSTWLFTLIAVGIVSGVLYFLPRVSSRWWAVAMGLILGGGLGNLIDRIVREPGFGQGHVIDFIRVPNWPVFNVADMAVVGGAALAVLLSLRGVELRPDAEGADPGVAEPAP